jgi:hypothetical protein
MAIAFDGPTKLATLSAGTTSLSVRDFWSRWVDWFLTSDNSKYLPAMSQVGGNDIDLGVGSKIPIYAFLLNGWKLKPQEANHTLNVTDGILLVDGGGDPFVNTSGSFVVRVNYQQPVQAISFSTGGSGLSVQEAERLLEVWQRLGLDSSNPMTTTDTEITTGAVEIQMTEPVAGTVVSTRQP